MGLYDLIRLFSFGYTEEEIVTAVCEEILHICNDSRLSEAQKARGIDKVMEISDALMKQSKQAVFFAEAQKFLQELAPTKEQ